MNAKQSSINVKEYVYPSAPAWSKGKTGMRGVMFETPPSKNCVYFMNTTCSAASTRYFKTVADFIRFRDSLRKCYESVEFWDDFDIPTTVFSIPVSVVCNMGSLRLYIRTSHQTVKLSKKHCEQLLWMFDNALDDLQRWETAMKELFGDDVPTMPRGDDGE